MAVSRDTPVLATFEGEGAFKPSPSQCTHHGQNRVDGVLPAAYELKVTSQASLLLPPVLLSSSPGVFAHPCA